MGSKHRKPRRVNIGNSINKKYANVQEYRVPLGSSSKANRRYKLLKGMLQDVISHARNTQNYADADTIYKWQKSTRFRVKLCHPWTIYLEPEEWQALSRGLRALGGRHDSMYQWLKNHRRYELES